MAGSDWRRVYLQGQKTKSRKMTIISKTNQVFVWKTLFTEAGFYFLIIVRLFSFYCVSISVKISPSRQKNVWFHGRIISHGNCQVFPTMNPRQVTKNVWKLVKSNLIFRHFAHFLRIRYLAEHSKFTKIGNKFDPIRYFFIDCIESNSPGSCPTRVQWVCEPPNAVWYL